MNPGETYHKCVMPLLSPFFGLLSHCMLGDFSCFCGRLLIFFKLTFSKNAFRNTIRVPNCLNPAQDRHSVGPDLGTNSLQRVSAEDRQS